MKQLQKILLTGLLTIVCFSLVNRANAQSWGIIDSLKLIPSNPTTTSTIQVVCYSHFAYIACTLINDSVNINNFIITVNASHMQGGFSQICYSKDTITLGSNFSPGNYIVPYNLLDSNNAVFDIDTLYFTIPQPNGINENNIQSQIKFQPNPFNEFTSLIIEPAFEISNAEIKFYDLFGKEVRKEKIFSKETILKRKNLTDGFYTYKIIMKGSILAIGKLVIQ
jgi:hypothetical protein